MRFRIFLASILLIITLMFVSCQDKINNNSKLNTVENTPPPLPTQGTPNISNTPSTPSISNTISNTPKHDVVKSKVYLEGIDVSGKTKEEVLKTIEEIRPKFRKEPVDAVFNDDTWEVEQSAKQGEDVDSMATLDKAMRSPGNEKLTVVISKIMPKKTNEQVSKVKVIGNFSTKVFDKQEGRINNIILASQKLNDTVINPGEEFSFNGTLGKRTKSKGYEKAPVIIITEKGPKKDYGIGGGICQVSSTLYNAVTEAGLKVTERHQHNKAVGYVPKGKDATVEYGSKDLKFINTKSHPIKLKIKGTKNLINVKIYEKVK